MQNLTIKKQDLENNLLQQRNQVLAAQNQHLLTRIQTLSQELLQANNNLHHNYHSFIKQQQHNILTLLQDKIQALKTKTQHCNSDVGSKMMVLEELVKGDASVESIVRCMLEVIEAGVGQPKGKENSDLARISELLDKRKSKHIEVQQLRTKTTHFIKDPPPPAEPLSRSVQPIIQLYQQLIRQIKPPHVSTTQLNSIYAQMEEYMGGKDQHRTIWLQTNRMQREWELGLSQPLQLPQHTEQLQAQTNYLHSLKATILQNISQLCDT